MKKKLTLNRVALLALSLSGTAFAPLPQCDPTSGVAYEAHLKADIAKK